MGCDGGTIPKRDELVKAKKKPEQKDKDAERLFRWQHCAASQVRLKHPIVICELGHLYNKEVIINKLIEKSEDNVVSHIRNLKDVKELNLTRNPSYKDGVKNGEGYVDNQTAEFICPITSQEMNGNCRFYCIWTCGCILSEKALKEIKSDICHKCGKSYSNEDLIVINPLEDEFSSVLEAMVNRRLKRKSNKSKKEKRNIEVASTSSQGGKKVKRYIGEENPDSSKKGSKVQSYALSIVQDEEFSKLRANGGIASDPNASEVYKSIFDTHKSAENKLKSHWITCNPQYF